MQALTLTRTARSAAASNRRLRTPPAHPRVDRSLVAAAAATVASTILVVAQLGSFAAAGAGGGSAEPRPLPAPLSAPAPAPAPSYATDSVPRPQPAPAPDLLSVLDDLGSLHG